MIIESWVLRQFHIGGGKTETSRGDHDWDRDKKLKLTVPETDDSTPGFFLFRRFLLASFYSTWLLEPDFF